MISIHCNSALQQILADNGVTEYTPAYNGESAGLDLYNAGPTVEINPSHWAGMTQVSHSRVLISTGLHIALPNSYVALLRERSSVTKTPLILRAGVIDPGYTGEIFVNMVNVSSSGWSIPHGAKLPVQLIVTRFSTDFESVEKDEYARRTMSSVRQQGQIGSSDHAARQN